MTIMHTIPEAGPLPCPPTLLHYSDVPSARLADAARRGEVVRVARGWYTTSPDPARPWWEEDRRIGLDRLQALSRVLDDGLVITGLHAALLHGASVPALPGTVTVIGSVKASTTHRADHYRRIVRRLSDADVCEIDGIRVTTPERTAIEVARLAGPDAGLVVADSLIGQRFDLLRDRSNPALGNAARDEFRAVARQILRREPRLRANGSARAVIEYADGRAQTPIESQARRACLVLGMPRPRLQVPVPTDLGIFYPDFTIEDVVDGQRYVVHVEADGDAKYLNGVERGAERAREEALERQGHAVARLTGHQLSRDADAAVRSHVLPLLPPAAIRRLTPVRGLDQRVWYRVHGGRRRLN